MIIELKLIIHYKSLTCNAPQMPRFCRPKITLSCIRFKKFVCIHPFPVTIHKNLAVHI